MNERYRHGDVPPGLSAAEINLLIAKTRQGGRRSEADYPDVQATDQPTPCFYVLEVDPGVVQAHMDNQGRYSEDVTGVVMEYDDARLLYKDGPILPAKMIVSIESLIVDELAPGLAYRKLVTYMLYLHPDAQWEVMESYYDDKEPDQRVASLAGGDQTGREVADGARKLNDDDVTILRLLI